MTGGLPARVGDLLGELSQRTVIDAPKETAAVWSRWREIVGAEIAGHAEPTSLKRGVLRVRADSPAWATEIGYLGEEILRRTNAAVGASIVTEVRVWTGPGSPLRNNPRGPGVGYAHPRATGTNRDAAEDPVTVFQRVRRAWSKRRAGPPPGTS